MPWPIRLVESRDAARAAYGYVPVGAMWPAPWLLDPDTGWLADYLGDHYRTDWLGTRPPLLVKLPDGSEFCVDSRANTRDRGLHGPGWKVTGEAPALTVSPSINIVGSYHGWIQNGVITDDCEGRQFPGARGFPS